MCNVIDCKCFVTINTQNEARADPYLKKRSELVTFDLPQLHRQHSSFYFSTLSLIEFFYVTQIRTRSRETASPQGSCFGVKHV